MKKSLLYAGICALIFAAVPFAAKAEARKLLKSGKRTEAIALINAAAGAIWTDAAALLGI